MMPGINPRDMQKAMKRLGIQQEEIPALEVRIKTNKGTILIRNPQVTKVNMMGQESFQISGDVIEDTVSDEDITMVMEQTGVSRDKAKTALEKHNGDLAEAILDLQKP